MQKIREAIRRFAREHRRLAIMLGFISQRRRPLTALFVVLMHTWGFFLSISALMDTRTPQGTIAWAVSLNTFPYLAVPAYLIFGESDFDSYRTTRLVGIEETRPMAELLIRNIEAAEASPRETTGLMEVIAGLSSLPVTEGNRASLLVDGKNTFQSIFEAVDAAEDYILLQFYIIRADDTGSDLKDRLVEKARQGVRVYVLYDDYGSFGLTDDFISDLKAAGARINSFMNLGGDANRFQLNFRNHRKIVVVDGKVAFVGGHNVGDEYLGKHPRLTPWRDSHLRITGPVVACVQVPFVEDWHWATGEIIEDLDWDVAARLRESTGSMQAVCVPSGPADPIETCLLFYLATLNAATERIWIATPYFVPDHAVVAALQLAAKRGVDVKIIIPDLSDDRLVHLSSFSYLDELERVGVEVHRYGEGFLHQKVVLVDDDFAAIGSANLDNRSFRLNFEAGIAVSDPEFAREVETMLKTDLEHSRLARASDLSEKPYLFRLSARVARLLAPIQ